MKVSTTKTGLVYCVILLILVCGIHTVLAEPAFQAIPCFEGENCPEHINSEADEYYTIQCANNAIWVWRSTPAPMFVTAIPIIQIEALTDNTPLSVPNEVAVIRVGDTVTISGSNGNLAPHSGSKSFGFNECVARNGGLPEIPTGVSTPTDGQAACLDLPTEQEVVLCLQNLLGSSCDDPAYAAMHLEECSYVSCPNDPDTRVVDLAACPTAEDLYLEDLLALISRCLTFSIPLTVGSFAIWGYGRKRK